MIEKQIDKEIDSSKTEGDSTLSYYIQLQSEVEDRLKSLLQTNIKTSEVDIWHEMAADYSDDWRQAKEQLDTAQQHLKELMSPEKTPLGLIGMALEAPSLNAAEEHYNQALASFVAIDETLRSDDSLSQTYNTRAQKWQQSRQRIDELQSLNKHLKKLNTKLGYILEQPTPSPKTDLSGMDLPEFTEHTRAAIQTAQEKLKTMTPIRTHAGSLLTRVFNVFKNKNTEKQSSFKTVAESRAPS